MASRKILAVLGIFFLAQLSPAQQCEELKASITQKIKDSTTCLADEDCAVGHFDCPFGCESIVRADQIKTIGEMNLKYSASCKRCTYDCYSPPAEVGCINNQCAKLTSDEILKRLGALEKSDCSHQEKNIKKILRTLNTCESDGDCVDAEMACPFGCRNLVGRKNKARAQAYLTRYSTVCTPVCRYKCGPTKSMRCLQKTCVAQ